MSTDYTYGRQDHTTMVLLSSNPSHSFDAFLTILSEVDVVLVLDSFAFPMFLTLLTALLV